MLHFTELHVSQQLDAATNNSSGKWKDRWKCDKSLMLVIPMTLIFKYGHYFLICLVEWNEDYSALNCRPLLVISENVMLKYTNFDRSLDHIPK